LLEGKVHHAQKEILDPQLSIISQAKTGEAKSIIAANIPKSTINLLNCFSPSSEVPTQVLFPTF
jgi:hypothetical protein